MHFKASQTLQLRVEGSELDPPRRVVMTIKRVDGGTVVWTTTFLEEGLDRKVII